MPSKMGISKIKFFRACDNVCKSNSKGSLEINNNNDVDEARLLN